ncbi:AbrB/MazE/SpoVT family DNA-binding domain-containing protein [Candidatus Micrarchaeota archaeon]|nr:AbrB/MazE/SpoVT family DNA-binding domain-containing protein [Candidatus Micrarchaeota archaeon]
MSDVGVVTVSERGQIVLPKKTRDELKVKKGTKLLLVEIEGKITLSKVDDLIKEKENSEGIATYIASEKSLKKDWGYKGDEVWDDL